MKTLKTKKGTELPLANLKGKDYLQVAYRLVWFREEHPDWSIETDFVTVNEQSAVVKAIIKDQSGRIIATSHKEESLKDFPAGFREKAETGAIGRALALCGYGTQFEPELDEGSRVVDSPIGNGGIHPEQPDPRDGVQREGFVMPQMPKGFEHLTKKYLEDIHRDDLCAVATAMEEKYPTRDKMPQKAGELYDRVCSRIVEIERGASA